MKNTPWIRAALAAALAASAWTAAAHGDEPHGDAANTVAPTAAGVARIEAATESFELVGRLEHGALTLYINRFESSEPILQAQVELESGDRKAPAVFRADQGSYVVSEPQLLQALARPGSHPVVVTVTAGNEADLLEATLAVAAADTPQDAEKLPLGAALAGVLGLGAVGAGGFVLRTRRSGKGGQR